MENSFLFHCLQLYSASGEGKLLNTITVSNCTVNESKAWTNLVWDDQLEVSNKSPAVLECLAQCRMSQWPCLRQYPCRGDGWARLISEQVGILQGILTRSLMKESQQLSPWERLNPNHERHCRQEISFHSTNWKRHILIVLGTSKSS